MSFGGFVSAMITSLKNNSRQKNRKSYFKKDKSFSNKENEKNVFLDTKATPEQLEAIRKNIRNKNRKDRMVNVILLVFVIIVTAIILYYFNMIR